MEEIWKDVKGYEGLYQVSNLGRIKSLRKGILCKFYNKNSYYGVDLYYQYKRKKCYVHRLVAESFIDNPDGKKYVDHINTDRHDNRSCNLRWTTALENCNNPLTAKNMSDGNSRYKYKGSSARAVAIAHGVNPSLLYYRMKKGLTIEQAIEVPVQTNMRRVPYEICV